MGKEKKDSFMSMEEEYSLKPIPDEMKKSWKITASIYAGMCAVIACCMAGGGLISGLTMVQSLWAMVIGLTILIFIYFVPMGKMGGAEGLSTYVLGEAAFGKQGSNLATSLIVTAVPCIAWYGIQVTIASAAVASVFGFEVLGTNMLTIFFGILFAVPAMYGLLSMAWLDYVSIPVMLYIVFFGASKAIGQIGGMANIWAYVPAQNMGLLAGINLQIGMLLVGGIFVADYTRWHRDKTSDIIKAGTLGIYPFTLILTGAGMIMSLSAVSLGVTDPWNIVSVMIKLGMPSIALLLIFLLQWTTNVTSAYSSGLALNKVFGGKRYIWTMVAAILGTILALTGIINHFLGFVNILSAWISPVAGVMIAEYYFVSKKKLVRKEGVYWPGIICWLIGGIVAWKVIFFIPALNGFILSAVLYSAYHSFFTVKEKAPEALTNKN